MDSINKDIFKFIKFAFVGVMNTLINWIIFFILNKVGIYYVIANIIAYTIATIHSYFWNSIWVFKYTNSSKIKTSMKFMVLNLIALLINTCILYVLVDIFNINKLIALILTTGIVMVINYIVNKIWVFNNAV